MLFPPLAPCCPSCDHGLGPTAGGRPAWPGPPPPPHPPTPRSRVPPPAQRPCPNPPRPSAATDSQGDEGGTAGAGG